MIQKIRWLSALALLLAVGAVTVRAEEEEAPPSSRPTAELLPAPLPVAVDRPCCTPALPPGMWSFFAPAPFPCPCPAPLMPAGFVSYGDGCACPSCSCPNCPLCTMSPSAPAEEYVVDLKMVEGGDGDPDTAISHPRLCVLEGQTGTVQTAAAGSKEQSTLQMQATLTKLDVGAILNLRVEQGSSFTPGNNVLQAHTETTEHRLPVVFGKATKLELTHDSNGACTSWVEVTVTKVETEKRKEAASGCSCPKAKVCEEEEEDAAPAGVGDFVDVLVGFFDVAAEMASTVTGTSSSDEPAVSQAEYLQHPPLYCPEMSASGTCTGSCAASAHSCCTSAACTQCAAVEAEKRPTTHIRICADHGRKSIEIIHGDMRWTGYADRVTIIDGCIKLEHCQLEASDGSMSMSADMKTVLLDKSNVEIEIGD